MLHSTFYYLGLLTFIYILYGTFRFFYNSFIRTDNTVVLEKLKKQGYAIVTGATFGIGSGFAKELARRKFNLILIARTKSKLAELQKELTEKYGVKVEIIPFDFLNGDYPDLQNQLSSFNVSILVNNVGMYTEYMKFFAECTEKESIDMIQLNTITPTKITHMVLPSMLEKKNGVIINVSSQSSVYDVCTPLFSVYAGTKAFNRKFSTSLNTEYSSQGIQSLCIIPAFVTSKITKIRKSGGIICDEITLANESLKYIGSKEQVVSPWYRHELQRIIISLICSTSYGENMITDWAKKARISQLKKIESRKNN